MNAPFSSIIMPTYNRSDVIIPVINAILEQDCLDFELIII